jgi:hypothetical protein
MPSKQRISITHHHFTIQASRHEIRSRKYLLAGRLDSGIQVDNVVSSDEKCGRGISPSLMYLIFVADF